MEVSQTLEEYTDFFNAPPHARKKNVSKAQERKDRPGSFFLTGGGGGVGSPPPPPKKKIFPKKKFKAVSDTDLI